MDGPDYRGVVHATYEDSTAEGVISISGVEGRGKRVYMVANLVKKGPLYGAAGRNFP